MEQLPALASTCTEVTFNADPDHEAVLSTASGRVIIVAPPGTGKTSLAVRLAAQSALTLPDHQRVLVLTFSNQARAQLEREAERVIAGPARRRIHITNYHRFFWRAVGANRAALGLPIEVRITSGARRRSLLRGSAPASRRLPTGFPLEAAAELRHPAMRPVVLLAEADLETVLAVVEREHTAGRLVFDDLAALFWTLITRYPTVGQAYRERYPIVIADEHQDASGIQDAFVRWFGGRLVLFADPMQLIHGFRGADSARLERHRSECDEEFELRTPHRWFGDPSTGQWLLGVRACLQGGPVPTKRPPNVRVRLVDPRFVHGAMLAAARIAVRAAFAQGCRTVAVLAYQNNDVDRVRDYFCRHGMFPRQLGIRHASFDRLTEIPDELPGWTDREVATKIVETLWDLVPGTAPAVRLQVLGRIKAAGVDVRGSGADARLFLLAAEHGTRSGGAGFFLGVAVGLASLRAAGRHDPARDEARLYEAAAAAGPDLEAQLAAFGRRLSIASHLAPRIERGLMTMTAHQSKGREFDGVVLYNATVADYPPEDDERRRLFYVAITRARRSWDIIAPQGQETPLLLALGS